MLVLATLLLAPATLRVGDGYPFARIEDAVAAAHGGETIEVHPSAEGYARTAVQIDRPNLTFKAFGRIVLDGGGFEYSGAGRTPRAIFQVDQNGSGAEIDGFELTGAHNRSYNGAGVRINGANDVSVRGCDIHGNDMGGMSNNIPGKLQTASRQLFDGCRIHENGSLEDPGQNHNLYLGGDSAWIYWCHVFGALTGHDVKTRAHLTRISDSIVYGGNNRQIDAVESEETELPGSDVVLERDLIANDPRADGNRNVIHFGQERGRRWGTLRVIDDLIVTHFAGPVFDIDAREASVDTKGSYIFNPNEENASLVLFTSGAPADRFMFTNNWVSVPYAIFPGNRLGDSQPQADGFGGFVPLLVGAGGPFTRIVPSRVSNPWKEPTTEVRQNVSGADAWWQRNWGASPKAAIDGL